MNSSDFDLQPILSNELVTLRPLRENDFEALYSIASDPLLWEQHPNKDRYKKEVFGNFFKGAMESKGAFLITKTATQEATGCSRYYNYDPEKNSIEIGYTFVARHCWGGGFNPAVKALMLEHAFRFVEEVLFHIGAVNIRSQKAIGRLGAIKLGEEEIAYYGEASKLNYIYSIRKENWIRS